MKKDIIKQNEETTDYIVGMVLNYYDDELGERYYDLEGIKEELENHIIGIIDTHKRKGIKINTAYLDMLERVI